MRICRFDDERIGFVRNDLVYDVTSLVGAGHEPVLTKLDATDLPPARALPLERVRLLSPLRAPGKIVAAPVNYKAHIAEMHRSNASPGHNLAEIDKAGLFLKAGSSLVGPSQGIAQRFLERRTDYEVELAVVIGRQASAVARERALDYVAGYCLGLDITLRGTEDRSLRKSLDSYTVLGPWFTSADEVRDPGRLRLTLRQNGELRQNASTADMVWDVSRLIEFATSFYTLQPGDVLLTGTPEGVGPIRPGDRLVAACHELGAMAVAVRAHR